jgi:hypothetical protein
MPLRHKYLPQHPIPKKPCPISSLRVKDKVSRPYKTTGKIIALYSLIFIYFHKQHAKDFESNGRKFSLNFVCLYCLNASTLYVFYRPKHFKAALFQNLY